MTCISAKLLDRIEIKSHLTSSAFEKNWIALNVELNGRRSFVNIFCPDVRFQSYFQSTREITVLVDDIAKFIWCKQCVLAYYWTTSVPSVNPRQCVKQFLAVKSHPKREMQKEGPNLKDLHLPQEVLQPVLHTISISLPPKPLSGVLQDLPSWSDDQLRVLNSKCPLSCGLRPNLQIWGSVSGLEAE